jgi:hypothetical protein
MGKLKTGGRCPKCGGNLYLDRDYNGWYEQCLQCAYMRDLAVVFQGKKKPAGELPEPIPVKRRDNAVKKDIPTEK